jgi:starvation-inducible DNA-binding protein
MGCYSLRRIMKQNHSKQQSLTGHSTEIQRYGTVVNRPISLDHEVRHASVESLNQILADTVTLRDMYKKHHWQVSGPMFYPMHLLFDKHYGEQAEIVDALAERIQLLGGVALAMAHDIAETTRVARPPRGREELTVQLFRLQQAHELIISDAREAAAAAAERGDDGTNDLLISDLLRVNEFQVWFVSEHLVNAGIADQEEDSARPAVTAKA